MTIERGSYTPPEERRWVPAALPEDQCDRCGSHAVAGYWVSIDPETGRRIWRRILESCCHDCWAKQEEGR